MVQSTATRAATSNTEILEKAITILGRARQLEEQCSDLANTGNILLGALEQRPSTALTTDASEKLSNCLEHVLDLAIQCLRERGASLNVQVEQTVPKLKQQLQEWTSLFTSGTSVRKF